MALLIAIGVPEISGALIGILTSYNVKTWYGKLKKPSFCPPNWIFGVVWPVLYAVIGLASYLIYEDGGFRAQLVPLAVYISNLVVNNLWSVIFFGAHRMLLVNRPESRLLPLMSRFLVRRFLTFSWLTGQR